MVSKTFSSWRAGTIREKKRRWSVAVDPKLEASSDSGVRQARTIHQSAEQLVTMSTPVKMRSSRHSNRAHQCEMLSARAHWGRGI